MRRFIQRTIVTRTTLCVGEVSWMKVKKERSIFEVAMKSELDILNYGGHDYLLSASALPLEEHLFQPHFSILGKKMMWQVMVTWQMPWLSKNEKKFVVRNCYWFFECFSQFKSTFFHLVSVVFNLKLWRKTGIEKKRLKRLVFERKKQQKKSFVGFLQKLLEFNFCLRKHTKALLTTCRLTSTSQKLQQISNKKSINHQRELKQTC